jgi:hypothetical protein
MATTNKLRQFRILPMGGAKARTNDNTGQKAPEDEFVRYNHN